MNDDYIKKALEETLKQLAELFFQDKALDKQKLELHRNVFKLINKANSLAALCDDLPANSMMAGIAKRAEKMGLTDSIRYVLYGTGEWMTATQLRDYLVRLRTDLTRYNNPLGSIHTILGRLVESEQVEQKIDEKTKKPAFRATQPTFWDESTVPAEEIAKKLVTPKARIKSGKKSKKKEMVN